MATYDSLHRQCRTLESLFDSKLTSYAHLAASISRAGTNGDLEAGPSWREAESEVEDLLEKVRLLLSAFLSFDEPRRPTCEFCDGLARRDEFGARRRRSRH
jgi:golgi SNAP receptor complex member 1